MRRLLKLLALILLALLLLGPAARAQDFRVTASSPAPGDSSVALRDTVTFTFDVPLDTTQHFGAPFSEWPVAFLSISPRDAIQVDSIRYSADLMQIRFHVTHAPETDFVWMLSAAYVKDTISITGFRRAWLEMPHLLRYTTASTTGRYSVSGKATLCYPTKQTATVAGGYTAALLHSQPEMDETQNIVGIDSLWTDVAAAAVAEGGPCHGDYTVPDVWPGTYWPVAIHDVDYAVAYDYLPDGTPDSIVVADSSLTGVDIIAMPDAAEEEARPHATVLHANRPNPFRTATRLSFTLERPARVRLVVYDVLGRRVATLAEGLYPAGEHAVTWQAAEAPSGVYLVRLEGGGFVLARPVVRVR